MNDLDPHIDQKVLFSRYNGNLPKLRIGAENYFVDIQERVLRNCYDPSKTTTFLDLYEFYDPKEKKFIVPFRHDTGEFGLRAYNPEDKLSAKVFLTWIEFPAIERMDPVGHCWISEMSLHKYLAEHPPACQFVADISVKEKFNSTEATNKIYHGLLQQNCPDVEEKRLPVYKIYETDYLVDVDRNRFYEKNNILNSMYLFDMAVFSQGYGFWYDKKSKNLGPGDSTDAEEEYILIPCLTKIAPEEMARKYGKDISEVIGKTDYEIMVDPEVLKNRKDHGAIPTMDLAGHPFYPRVRENLLQPKDDFSTMGISYDFMERYLYPNSRGYLIPFDPKKHNIREIDLDTVTEYPKDIIPVEIPLMHESDPFGYARKHQLSLREFLMEYPPKAHITTKIYSWKETRLPEIIEANRKKLQHNREVKPKQQPKKGRSM